MKISSIAGCVVLEEIPFAVDRIRAGRDLGLGAGGDGFESFSEMARGAEEAGAPSAAYRECSVSVSGGNIVALEGVELKSRVLAANLRGVSRTAVYAVTSGRELDRWSARYGEALCHYFADYIKEAVLSSALAYFYGHLKKRLGLSEFSKMAPGGIPDWPITEQEGIFRLLGRGAARAGIELTERFLMLPSKSVSGILLPSVRGFESCLLCPREKCSGRRASYDRNLYPSKYGALPCPERAARRE